MVSSVSSLLKIVKNVEDEAGRGVKTLENAIDTIKEGRKSFRGVDPPKVVVSPEQFIRAINAVTLATAKSVSAGNSTRQEDITAAANMSRSALIEMMRSCKASAVHAETPELREHVMQCGDDCSQAYVTLLEHVHSIIIKPTYEKKQKLLVLSREVANTVSDLVSSAEALKGSDWINPEDPTVIAENELMKAAASIELAAKRLEELQPRREVSVDETLTFDEQIVEAAKSIARATSQLVKAATDAQRELVAQGRVRVYNAGSEDYQWSEGLVSAAKLVATATGNLCEAANLVVRGQASEEKLIAAAKAVASCTAQLLLACQVKADARSDSNRRLQNAGAAVKKATESLVRAANAVKQQNEDISFFPTGATNLSMTKRMAAELDAVEKITAKERELKAAMEQLKVIRLQSTKATGRFK